MEDREDIYEYYHVALIDDQDTRDMLIDNVYDTIAIDLILLLA